MAVNTVLSLTVVYAVRPREVLEIKLEVPHGCTVAQALECSGVLNNTAATDLPSLAFGVWGKKVAASHVLQHQDRVEIYRVLTVDPKVARRERFVRQGAKQAAGLFAKRRVGGKAGY